MRLYNPLKDSIIAICPFIWTIGKEQGVRTVYETLQGYVRKGFKVDVVMCSNSDPSFFVYSGMNFYTFRIPFLLKNRRYGLNRSIFSFTLSRLRILTYILDKFLWIQFVFLAYLKGLSVVALNKPCLFYGFTPYGVPVAYLLGKTFGLPNVSRLLGTFLTPYVWTDYSSLWSKFLNLLLMLGKFGEVLAFKTPCRLLIVTNDGTRGADVAKSLRVPLDRVWVPINGFVIPQPSRNRQIEIHRNIGLPRETQIMIYVGQLIRWKRVDRVIRTFCEVKRRYSRSVALLIVGDGKERKNLERLASHCQGKSKIYFQGSVPYSDVWNYMQMSDVFLSLNDLTNACNTLFEAMFCKVSIVTLNNGSTSEFIKHKWNGMLLEFSDDVNKISNAVIDLLSNPLLRKKLVNNAFKYAQRNLVSWEERMNLEILKIFHNL